MTISLTWLRRATLFVVATLTMLQQSAWSQSCGTAAVASPPPSGIYGGMYIPSGNGIVINGVATPSPATIYALVLFLEFPDDQEPNTVAWMKGSPPALMMKDIIDRPGAPSSGNKYNITTYFRDMSGDRLRIVGNCWYAKTRYSLAQYKQTITQSAADSAGHPDDAGKNFGAHVRYWAVRHVLEDMGAGGFNFSDYDTWELNGQFNYRPASSPASDSTVDLIITCWRNHGNLNGVTDPSFLDNGQRISGIANLGDSIGTIRTGITDKRRKITFGYPGSGVSAFDMAGYPDITVPLHEIGHLLLGGDHHYDGGMWALMGTRTPNVSSCMNAYERNKLGWGTIQYIQSDGETHLLADYPTTHLAYALTADPNFGEYFLFENHQRLPSPYISTQGMDTLAGRPWGNSAHDRYWNVPSYDIVDQTIYPADSSAEGLYIIRQMYPAAECPYCLQVVCADGRWNWAQVSCPFGTTNAPWGDQTQTLPVWQRTTIDRDGGLCDRQARGHGYSCATTPQDLGEDFLWAWRDPEYGTVVNDMAKQRGDHHDMWDTEHSTVFSRWSNPSSRALFDSTTTVGMEVLSKVGNGYNVKFYLTSALDAPPSRPQDLRVASHSVSSSSGYTWIPRLTWDANPEPDVVSGGTYHIYRRTEWANGATALPWDEIATVGGTVTQYDDLAFWNDVSPFDGTIVRYRIQCVDSQSLASGYSEEPSMPFQGAPKLALPPEAVTGSLTGLEARCAPNPCSGRGAITYLLPADGRVRLTLYDALGRRVAMLADEVQPAGRHNAWFDASELVPGVYAWMLEFGGGRVGDRVVVVR